MEIKRRTRPPVPTFQEVMKANQLTKAEFDNDGGEFTASHIKELAKFENEVIDNAKELPKGGMDEETDRDR